MTVPEPIPYDNFRTGFTFRDVYEMLSGRKWRRRHGVLGYWRQLKLAMYADYLATHGGSEHTPSSAPIPD